MAVLAADERERAERFRLDDATATVRHCAGRTAKIARPILADAAG